MGGKRPKWSFVTPKRRINKNTPKPLNKDFTFPLLLLQQSTPKGAKDKK